GPRKSSSVCILTAAFVLRKSAQENSKAQVDCCAVQRIYRVVKIEPNVVVRVKLACATDQHGGEIMPYAPVAEFVRIGQSRFCDRITKTHAIELARLCVQTSFDIAQALAICHLREGHRAKLLGTTKCARTNVAAVLRNQTIKTRPRNEVHD